MTKSTWVDIAMTSMIVLVFVIVGIAAWLDDRAQKRFDEERFNPRTMRWAIGCPSGQHPNDGRCSCT